MKIARLLIVLVVIAAGAAGGAYVWFARAIAAPGPLTQPVTIIIAPRTGVSAIAQQLADAGVVASPWMVMIEARRSKQDRALKPGEYRFDPGVSLIAAMDKIVKHDVVARFVTIPEGLTTNEITAIIAAAEGLTGDVTSAIRDGDLLPETYRYEWGDSREALVARMRATHEAALQSLWAGRPADFPLKTPQEVVVLASIIEKETGLAAERARVAGVFLNRLKRGMKLQSDPTVAYGIAPGGDLERPLTYKDLAQPTPFNTYVIPALPPSPICHPGLAALRSVFNPVESQDLYFVADGSGGHAFAPTLEEHNRNVARWRQFQRQNNLR